MYDSNPLDDRPWYEQDAGEREVVEAEMTEELDRMSLEDDLLDSVRKARLPPLE